MPIRVLVVDDSLICREMLSELLERSGDIQVVGTAKNGKEAIQQNTKLHPDLITMDIHMPGLDGFGAIEEIMASQPAPILVVTSSPVHDGVDRMFRALAVGALDLMQKPELEGDLADVLRQKVKLLSGVRVVHRRRAPRPVRPIPAAREGERRSVVAIAASTGGPKLLLEILGGLPRNFGACILLTQHIPDGFSDGFASWLDDELALDVGVARESDAIAPGRVLVAPSDRHLGLRTASKVTLLDDPPLHNLRPSGTRMFRSVASACGPDSIGIVLSGMGRDGAEGLLELRRAGGLCIAQDKDSSLVFGMPRAAIELGAVDKVLDVEGIQNILLYTGAVR